ncbi:MAG: GAF domain-containing protein [bacterium]
MEKELEILIKRIIESGFLVSKHDQSIETFNHALHQTYEEFEKYMKEQTANLISLNIQLHQEIAEHIKTEYALYYRAEFEKLIATLSANFIKFSQMEIQRTVKNALQRIGTFVGVDRSYVFFFSGDKKRVEDIYEWRARGIKPQITDLRGHLLGREFPWFAKKIKRRGVLYIPSCSMLPPEAQAEKEYFQAHGIKSLVTVPMFCGRSLIGCVGFDSVREKKKWAVDIIALLRIVGEIFANAFDRNNKDVTSGKNERKTGHCSRTFQIKRDLSMPLTHKHIQLIIALKMLS